MDLFERLWSEAVRLMPFAAFFVALALITKRKALLESARNASPEIRTNIGLFVFDMLFIAPFVSIPSYWIIETLGLTPHAKWNVLPAVFVCLTAVIAGDYIGYWRHRINHTPALWPIHATHHSDRCMNWFSLLRIHPLERFYSATIDSTVLAVLGFPFWAIVANNLVRNGWGFFIHADLPWNLGPLGKVLISPSTHRWHHARNEKFSGKNFATVFTFWDRLHGTYQASDEACREQTGLDDHSGGVMFELLSPFKRVLPTRQSNSTDSHT